MKKVILSSVLGFCLMLLLSVNAMANVVAEGVTVKKTGTIGAITYLVCTLSGSTTEVWYVIPTGTTYNSLLATALSAQSVGKTIRLVMPTNFNNGQSVVGIMMEN